MSKKLTINLKHSVQVRRLIEKRTREQGYLQKDMINDAEKNGRKIDKGSLSRFFKKDRSENYTCEQKGCLSEEIIAWLCVRWGITCELHFVVEPYNEEKNLAKLKAYSLSYRKHD